VGCRSARGSFYRAGGWEGRRCSEGNGQRRRCTFKAFNSSVMGGERRGEWGVKGEGKCGTISGRGVWSAQGRWRRRHPVGLTDRVGPPISEGEAMGRQGRKGREEVGHGWAGKEGRRPGQNHCSG
jgi:hypothetical protein